MEYGLSEQRGIGRQDFPRVINSVSFEQERSRASLELLQSELGHHI